MNITSHYQACRILGVPASAGEKQIKDAYKRLCKQYHPDVQPDPALRRRYYEVTAAYEYLKGAQESRNAAGNPSRIVGGGHAAKAYESKRRSREDYAKWQRQEKKRKQEKREAFEKRQQEYREQKQYEEAMDAIHAIRAAQILRRMMRDGE